MASTEVVMCTDAQIADADTGDEHDRRGGPAINRMTAEERAIVVRWLATIALERALEDLNGEDRANALVMNLDREG